MCSIKDRNHNTVRRARTETFLLSADVLPVTPYDQSCGVTKSCLAVRFLYKDRELFAPPLASPLFWLVIKESNFSLF